MVDGPLRIAAMTCVYNEKDNLPVWCNYYGKLFLLENLFVIDDGSTDGSTSDLGAVNVIRLPRKPFDDDDKSAQMSSLHALLLRSYDVVVAGDCDELLVADPGRHYDLSAYIDTMCHPATERQYATGMGMNVTHILTHEAPLDPTKPILGQRGYWSFASSMCKTLVSRLPLEWCAGLHAHRKPPLFDPELLVVHTKLRDYSIAMRRQGINGGTVWSKRSIAANHGVHHRYGLEQFVSDCFLHAVEQVRAGQVHDLNLTKLAVDLQDRTIQNEAGFWQPPFGVNCMFKVPKRFYGLA